MWTGIPHRLFVFDCDGTLVDSQHNIVAAMSAAWSRRDPPPAAQDVRRIVGLTLEVAIARLLPEASEALHRELAADYRAIVHDLRANEAPDAPSAEPLFPGIRALIEDLAAPDVFLGVATGKNLRGVEHTLRSHGLRERFHTLQAADICRGKPDPDMVLKAMAETAARPEATVVIGDTSFDMEMARAAGATAVGVAWGYHEVADLWNAGAQAVISRPAELLGELRRMAAAA
jgi:phosphoglycolate phosphatase